MPTRHLANNNNKYFFTTRHFAKFLVKRMSLAKCMLIKCLLVKCLLVKCCGNVFPTALLHNCVGKCFTLWPPRFLGAPLIPINLLNQFQETYFPYNLFKYFGLITTRVTNFNEILFLKSLISLKELVIFL